MDEKSGVGYKFAVVAGGVLAFWMASSTRHDANSAHPNYVRAFVTTGLKIPVNGAYPIDLSPGFEYLGTPVEETDPRYQNWRFHQKLQAETRDDAWATRTEDALTSGIRATLVARGVDPLRVELPVVECRTTGCEIQSVTASQDIAGVGLQTILPALLQGNLGDELNGYSITLSPYPYSGHTAVLVQLPRRKS